MNDAGDGPDGYEAPAMADKFSERRAAASPCPRRLRGAVAMRHRLTLQFRDPAISPLTLDAPNMIHLTLDGRNIIEYAGFLPDTLRLTDSGFSATFDVKYWWPIPPYSELSECTMLEVAAGPVPQNMQSQGKAVVTERRETGNIFQRASIDLTVDALVGVLTHSIGCCIRHR